MAISYDHFKYKYVFIFTYEYNRISARLVYLFIFKKPYMYAHVCTYVALENEKAQK